METAKIFTIKTDVASKARDYLNKKDISIEEFSKAIGFSRPAVSSYLAGKYASNPKNIENAILTYLKEVGEDVSSESVEQSQAKPQRSSFFVTQDASNIIGVCQSCQEFKALGIIVGRSGYGKTHTLKQFSKMNRVCYIECDDSMGCRDLVESMEDALGIPQKYGSISKRVKGIKEFFNVNRGYLLIIDEADKLLNKYTQKKMEILRTIFDQSEVGMIIAGEPKLEGMIKSYLPRFANRVDFYTNLKGLSRKEVEKFLEGYSFTEDALTEMAIRATNNKTGCFRLLDRTLKNILRIVPQDSDITLDVIEKASRMMML